MKNYLVLLRKNNTIIEVLGQFRTKSLAIEFVEENFIEFYKDICQYSKFESNQFITISK